MKKYQHHIFLLIAILGFVVSCSTSPTSNKSLQFSQSLYYVSANSSIEVGVMVKNVKDLYACSMDILFDPGTVAFEGGSLHYGTIWPRLPFSFLKKTDDGVSICMGLQESGLSITNSGMLFNFRLKALTQNETAVSFKNVTLINEKGKTVSGFSRMKIRDSYLIVE